MMETIGDRIRALRKPNRGYAFPEYLNQYELDLINHYRLLSEREQGKVDQFLDSLLARKEPPEKDLRPGQVMAGDFLRSG